MKQEHAPLDWLGKRFTGKIRDCFGQESTDVWWPKSQGKAECNNPNWSYMPHYGETQEKEKKVPTPGIEPGPRRWERRILTTRPYGNSTRYLLFYICHTQWRRVNAKNGAPLSSTLIPSLYDRAIPWRRKYLVDNCSKNAARSRRSGRDGQTFLPGDPETASQTVPAKIEPNKNNNNNNNNNNKTESRGECHKEFTRSTVRRGLLRGPALPRRQYLRSWKRKPPPTKWPVLTCLYMTNAFNELICKYRG